MPEIKHSFQGGKMNKDLDERLVPNGEYRDAMNIQVTTTGTGDSIGDVGAVQNIQGNKLIGESLLQTPWVTTINNPNEVSIIASIADEKTNKAYFFVAGLKMEELLDSVDSNATFQSPKEFVDTIVEVDTGTGAIGASVNPVVVDRWGYIASTNSVFGEAQNNQLIQAGGAGYITVADTSKYRVGMTVRPFSSDGSSSWASIDNVSSPAEEPRIIKINTNANGTGTLFLDTMVLLNTSDLNNWIFKIDRALNFDNSKKITGINIIDDLLFWTDGVTEPKKINITKCKEGTPSMTSHTQLRLSDPYDNDELLPYIDQNVNPYITQFSTDSLEMPTHVELTNDLKEEHIVVKHKAPTMAPTLHMDESLRPGLTTVQEFDLSGPAGEANANVLTIGTGNGSDPAALQQGDEITFSTNVQLQGLDWTLNDILVFKENTGPFSPSFTVSVDSYDSTNGTLQITVLSVSDALTAPIETIIGSGFWKITLEEKKPLFELKFGRFSIRYKYEDGEYSSFGPWSELAFLPGSFDYDHRKGYNLGMTNQVRDLVIKDFIPHQRSKPDMVKSVDILYKTADSPNVYIVKTITRGRDPEWDLFYPGEFQENMMFGEFRVSSEIIHKAVDKNQLLRAWDNVPRFAKTQEIAANRLIYANYTQGYNIRDSVGLTQTHKAYDVPGSLTPKKSIKSIRNYKFGMVFGDKYGRETPVIAPGYITGDIAQDYTLLSGDVSIEKEFSAYQNKFEVKQEWENQLNSGLPEDWMEYVKYYVKETSNEYYNLVMDRWYDAEDGNIWLSFPSADRNKVDEETYLILKNEHGTNIPVPEIARYKIIAIESDAPDFIKLDPRPMGVKKVQGGDVGELFSDATYDTATDSPTRLMGDDREIIMTSGINSSNWNNFLGGHLVLGQGKGTLKIRINCKNLTTGTELKGTKWNTVTYVSQSTNGETGTIRWAEPFLETADYIDIFNAAGEETTSGLEYSIELREFVVDNKAEFDGRFFVKIQRDDALRDRVLKWTNASLDWDSVATYHLMFIQSQRYHPSGARNSDGYLTGAASTYDDVEGSGTNRSGYNWGSNSNAPYNFSSGATNPDGTNVGDQWVADLFTSSSSGDRAHYFSHGCTGSDFSASANYCNQTKEYWEGMKDAIHPIVWRKFFVDGARAKMFRMFGYFCGNRDALDENNDPVGTFYNGIERPWYYKPTAFDKGWLTYLDGSGEDVNPTKEGHFGRVAVSMLPNLGSKAESLSGDQGDPAANCWSMANPTANIKEVEFFQRLVREGSYFKFSYDTSNNGTGFLYKIVSRGGGPPIFGGVGKGGDIDYWGPHLEDGDCTNNNQWVHNFCLGFGTMGESYYSGLNGAPAEQAGASFSYYSIGGTWANDMNTVFDLEGMQENLPESWDPTDGPGCNYFNPNSSSFPSSDWINAGSGDCHQCDPGNSGQGPFCGREGVRVEFRRCNDDGTLMYDEDSGAGSLGVDPTVFDPRATSCHDGREAGIHIRFYEKAPFDPMKFVPTQYAAVWETEPKEDVGLDVYYEASNAIPMVLDRDNTVDFAPYNCTVTQKGVSLNNIPLDNSRYNHKVNYIGYKEDESIIGIISNTSPTNQYSGFTFHNVPGDFNLGQFIVFNHNDGTKTMSQITGYVEPRNVTDGSLAWGLVDAQSTLTPVAPINWNVDTGMPTLNEPINWVDSEINYGFYKIDSEVWKYPVELGWHNCYSFGNGVESDRIRDDFNASQIGNGIKVSTTFLNYGEESKGSGMIYSGIYNATSGVNNLNEFNMAEKITKELNPSYGSIQRLKTRDTDVVVLAEDKVLKVIANKDALYNADGNAQLTATNRVLGTAVPFAGDYGISQNPESLAWDQFRMYFTDMQRGAVLRLSGDGLTPISNVGMKTWFRDNLKKADRVIGTYDTVNNEYNLTLNHNAVWNIKDKTVAFNEDSKGWVSFRSFIPETGLSVGGKYITGKKNKLYEHYVDITDANIGNTTFGDVINRNTFYAEPPYTIENMEQYYEPSSLTVVFNDLPGSVKTFHSINYEGSQGRINQFTDGQDETPVDHLGNTFQLPYGTAGLQFGDGEFYNLKGKTGWWVDQIKTDLDPSFRGHVTEFLDKEGKWFNYIDSKERGTLKDNDIEEFTVQGLGTATFEGDEVVTDPPSVTVTLKSDMVNDSTNPNWPYYDGWSVNEDE